MLMADGKGVFSRTVTWKERHRPSPFEVSQSLYVPTSPATSIGFYSVRLAADRVRDASTRRAVLDLLRDAEPLQYHSAAYVLTGTVLS